MVEEEDGSCPPNVWTPLVWVDTVRVTAWLEEVMGGLTTELRFFEPMGTSERVQHEFNVMMSWESLCGTEGIIVGSPLSSFLLRSSAKPDDEFNVVISRGTTPTIG